MLSRTVIRITECKPVYLSETEQGFHIFGTIDDRAGLPPAKFAFATDDVGNPLLKNWLDDMPRWSTADKAAILAAVEREIICRRLGLLVVRSRPARGLRP